jgi:hypothetical protein
MLDARRAMKRSASIAARTEHAAIPICSQQV